jgi:hypothetical protein
MPDLLVKRYFLPPPSANSIEFYCKHAGAIEIPDSDPGFYRGKIRQE